MLDLTGQRFQRLAQVLQFGERVDQIAPGIERLAIDDNEFEQTDLAHLGKGSLTLAPTAEWPTTRILRLVSEGLTVGIAVEGDVDFKKALDRLAKQIADADKETARIEGKLKSADFVSNAPTDVITEHRDRVRSLTRDRAMLVSSEQQLRAMLGA